MKNVYTTQNDFFALRKKMLNEVFDDSKQLRAKQREQILESIEDCRKKGFLVHESRILTPLEISELMTRDEKTNLNKMSHNTVVELIRRLLNQGINITRVFVDTVGPPAKYESFLENQFEDQSIQFYNFNILDIQFFVRQKADSLFKCVSAASIVAKVTRDRIVEEWKFRESGLGGKEIVTDNIGCGYPSDPKTKLWLREHLDENCGLPEIVRFSWKTTTNLMKERNCSVQFKAMTRNMTIEEYDSIGFGRNFLNPSDYIKGKF